MDNNGQHDPKRQRLGPEPPSWPGRHEEVPLRLPPIGGPLQGGPVPPFSRQSGHESPHRLDLVSRRNSEHSPAIYEQESRRPHSGPHTAGGYQPPPLTQQPPPNNHHQSPFGGPRADMLIKRDPSSDESQSLYRPSSRGNGPEHIANTPHPESHRQQFDPVPQPFRAPHPQSQYPPLHSQPPPHSPMHGDPYPYSSHGLPPQTYSSVSYPQPAHSSVKRKAQRAAQACDSCRTLKAKCDEGRPDCASCREKGIPCAYRDPPPKQQDKTSADILESLEGLKSTLTGLIRGLASKVDRLENLIATSASPDARMDAGTSLKEERDEEGQVAIPYHSTDSGITGSEVPAPPQHRSDSESPLSPSQVAPMGESDGVQDEELGKSESEVELGELVTPHESTIPVNHTTGASRLLLVGPIAELAAKTIHSSRLKNEMYPILLEEKRGLLRLFGRGEGLDRPPGYAKDPMVENFSESTSPETSIAEAESPPGEEWGQLGGLTPPGDDITPHITRGTVINNQGMPDFARETVHRLVQSYLTHMNNMHPILVPKHLDALVDDFTKSIPENQAKSKQLANVKLAGFVGSGSRNQESPGMKRKRSPGSVTENPGDASNIWDHKPGHPFRSISTALVLLVMALGEICESRNRIPEVPSDSDADAQNGYPQSPIQSSPIMSTSTGIPSPQDSDGVQSHSRRTSVVGSYDLKMKSIRAKNLDRIPGLAYFALGTDILGNQLAGNSLQHVHAFILASLYHGQLGRVLESHAYIMNACRGLQVVLRPKLERFNELANQNPAKPEDFVYVDVKDNPLIFAFWTCLQLESDIVAELPCPRSGILNLEHMMPYPNLREAEEKDGFDRKVIQSYVNQLYLRKHLNRIHKMLYDPANPDASRPKGVKIFKSIEDVEMELLGMKERLPPDFRWTKDSSLAGDILSARLRAKYYGAQVISYRTFLLRILEASGSGFKISEDFIEDVTISDATNMEYAAKCIDALINSTTAFHGLGDPGKDRLLVTNIWGTAHAQWGNVLTLLAAHRHHHLQRFINKAVLKDLLYKTLAFLKLNAQRGSALEKDWKILHESGIQAGLLRETKRPAATNLSFTSNSSGERDMPMPDY